MTTAGIPVQDPFNESGYFVARGAVPAAVCDALQEALDTASQRTRTSTGNRRNLFRDVPAVAALAGSGPIFNSARVHLGSQAFPVRALFFDKTPGANWSVVWHQDVTIAVQSRIEVPEFTGWSVKAGVPHVHAPTRVLERMLAARVHLDDCDADNGALQVIPGSHRHGKLSETQIQHWASTVAPVTCLIARGDCLVMRPLLLHSSARAQRPAHRRVIHIEYADVDLPGGLQWAERQATA